MLVGGEQYEPDRLADELWRQRPTHADLDELAALQGRVAGCERRYGLPSAQIHDAIAQGLLEETAEVCTWIIEYELLARTTAVPTR